MNDVLLDFVLEQAHKPVRKAMEFIRKYLRKNLIPFIPFGTDNEKTQTFSFYRKVGDTCPHDCPYLNKDNLYKSFCYACQGHTSMVQTRASTDPQATINSFIICATLGIVKNKTPARMNVSGDFAKDGKVDTELIQSLMETSRMIQKKLSWKGPTGYGYTHCTDLNLEECSKAGLEIRPSFGITPGAAIVWPFEKITELVDKYPVLTFQKCKKQTDKQTPCVSCRLCFTKKHKASCIIFNPHGICKNKYQSITL